MWFCKYRNPRTFKGGEGVWMPPPPPPRYFFRVFFLRIKISTPVIFSSSLFMPREILRHVQWRSVAMVTRYDVICTRWEAIFGWKYMFFWTSFKKKSKSCGLNHAKCLFMCYFSCKAKKKLFPAVLTWFLILGKIHDGDHCWWRHRAPVAPPPIKYTLSCKEDQRLPTESKIVSKYCNRSKTRGRGFHSPPLVPRWRYVCMYVRGLIKFHAKGQEDSIAIPRLL